MRKLLINIIKQINPFDDFDERTDLLGGGILDSLTLMIFIREIEERLDISILEEMIDSERFYNIESIEKLLLNLNEGKVS